MTNNVEAVDASSNNAWTSGTLNHQRVSANAVILADGTVLVIGGTSNAGPPGDPSPVYVPELLVPIGPQAGWYDQPPMASSRIYHSTGVLLPSGKVLSSGGEFGWLWTIQPGGRTRDYQVFVPPYLAANKPRPVITSVPSTMQLLDPQNPVTYKAYYTYSGQAMVSRVALVSPGSTTHHSDMHQRFVELVFKGLGSDATGNYVEFYPPLPMGVSTVPPLGSHAPKGYYMLFILTNDSGTTYLGVPSEAKWVKLQ